MPQSEEVLPSSACGKEFRQVIESNVEAKQVNLRKQSKQIY